MKLKSQQTTRNKNTLGSKIKASHIQISNVKKDKYEFKTNAPVGKSDHKVLELKISDIKFIQRNQLQVFYFNFVKQRTALLEYQIIKNFLRKPLEHIEQFIKDS